MIAAATPDFYEEHAWVLGDAADAPCLTEGACRLRETRIDAALFKRRWYLLIRWRQQTLLRARLSRAGTPPSLQHRASPNDEITIVSDLPRHFPPLREEIAILRAFLSREIDAILFRDT